MNQFSYILKIFLLCSISIAVFLFVIFKINNYEYVKNDNTIITGKVKKVKKNKIVINNYQVISQKNINVQIGDIVSIKGITKMPKVNTNFNLFNYRNYLLSQKINYIFYLKEIKIIKRNNSIKSKIINYINSINNPYLNTLILGDNQIDENEYEMIKTNGISHLFAISGMHISFISLTILFILNKINKRKKINIITVIFILLLYTSLVVISASIIRSILMFIFLNINNKKFKNIIILYLVFLLMLIYNPFYIYDLGFLYSFTCLFFILYFKPKGLLNTSILAFLATLPITINSSNEINLISPFLNLLFVPFITYIIFPFCFIVLLIPKLNFVLIQFLNILRLFNNISFKLKLIIIIKTLSPVLIVIYYILLILYLTKKLKYLYFGFIIFLYIRFNIYPIVTVLDVGQGDSILIELPFYNGNILIDTGGSKYTDINKYVITPFLKSKGITKIDYLILTHGDYDHMGSASNLLKSYNIKNVIMNSYSNNELEKKIKHPNIFHFSKNKLDINGNYFYFLNTINSSENNDSLIIYTILNKYKFLFMGDATKEEEKYIINNYNLKNIDFIKIAHHGSNSSTSKYFINKIKPSYALISVGEKNIYNHPNKEVIKVLNKCKIYMTSINGSIEIRLKNKLNILTCR